MPALASTAICSTVRWSALEPELNLRCSVSTVNTLPCGINSVIRHRFGGRLQAPMKDTTCGCYDQSGSNFSGQTNSSRSPYPSNSLEQFTFSAKIEQLLLIAQRLVEQLLNA